MSWLLLLPWFFLACAAFLAAVFDSKVRMRAQDHDSGPFWASVLSWLGVLFFLSWLSVVAESIDGWWQTGWHLQFDRVIQGWWVFPAALLLPFLFWGAMLVFLSQRPSTNRSLAGSINAGRSRMWVLFVAVPLLLPLLWLGPERLNSGADAYPAATWAIMAVTLISLIWLAKSRAATQALSVRPAPRTIAVRPDLEDWVAGMARQGIQLQALKTWAANPSPRRPLPQSEKFADRLRKMGAGTVVPQIVDAFSQLLSPDVRQGRGMELLLLTADDSGQIESIAMAATELASARQQCTLIITPRSDPDFLQYFEHCLERAGRAVSYPCQMLVVRPDTDLNHLANVWITDAAKLSDRVIVQLANPATASKVGLVVWLDVHLYTGVLAANAWAISRRLNRILKSNSHHVVHALAVMRSAGHADAQLTEFVRRLLPYSFSRTGEIVHVDNNLPREIHLHLHRSHRQYFVNYPQSSIQPAVRHPALVAALASAHLNWPTSLSLENHLPGAEVDQVLNQALGSATLKNALVDNAAEANARILQLNEASVLALVETVGQAGRASTLDLPHHVAMVLPWNPYVEFVLTRLAAENDSLETSRRLVGAEGQSAIFRRHLLLALSEQEDTRTGLRNLLLWDENVLDEILQEISDKGKLSRHQVRYVNENLQRVIDDLYSSRLERSDEEHPLDTVGDSLILVRAATEKGRVVMWVDKKRMPIQAYPGRIFVAGDHRYRIRNWTPENLERGWVDCQPDERSALTWRLRNPNVSRLRQEGVERTASESKMATFLRQFRVQLIYEEFVQGYIRREFDLTQGTFADTREQLTPIPTMFETMALAVEFVPKPDESAIRALCQAMRHALPVHLGVEPDALEVVPLLEVPVDGRRVSGFVIVDLYPGGIGLVEAISEDTRWMLDTLGWIRDWLTDAAAGSLSWSPLAVATSAGGEDPRDALRLLEQIVQKGRTHAKTHNKGKGI